MSLKDAKGTVYLLHFSKKVFHAQHYLGWTEDIKTRLQRHRSGTGSRLLRQLKLLGGTFQVVRTWEGVDKAFERKLKRRKMGPRLCTLCLAARRKPLMRKVDGKH